MLREFDAVRLVRPIAGQAIPVGAVGVVVHIHRKPCAAYEVEFANDQGETQALLTLAAEDLAVAEGEAAPDSNRITGPDGADR